jgi:predicted SnoaL-like aldol condensation-catalyzing enzyme
VDVEVTVDPRSEQNKQVIREWNELAFNQRRPEEAVARYPGSGYPQRDPGAADGAEPFIGFVRWFAPTPA